MEKRLHYLIVLIGIITLIGCDRDERVQHEFRTLPVKFNTFIVEDIQTRAKETSWENGDKIGIFAINSGTSLQVENIVNNYENLPFITTGDGVFQAESRALYYPEDNKNIDIIAYYPYKSGVSDYECPIDITEQQDFFYSTNLKNATDDGVQKTLEFQRVLSKVVFNITTKNNASLELLDVLLSGVKTKARFALGTQKLEIDNASAKTLTLDVKGSATQKQVEVILLPTTKTNDIAVTFQVGSQNVYTWKIPHELEQGKVYTYNVELDKLSTVVSRPKDYMEIPYYTTSEVAPHSYKAVHMIANVNWLNPSYSGLLTRNYTILFDTQNRLPYWIAYPMHPMYLRSGNRTNDWEYDPKIPRAYQPNLSKSWTNRSYNRGHMLASADRNATTAINRTTFYYTNMVPQDTKMNGGTWNDLEQRVRYWCKQTSQYDTLYVVTGAILPKSPENIRYTTDRDGKKSALPKYLYKALLRKEKKTGKYYAIGFKMENKNTGISYRNSVVSVSQLEQETGFTFFPQAPDIETVKQQKDMTHWN